MKVALIDPSLFTWPYDVHLARGIELKGHEAVIFGKNPGRPLPPDEARFLRPHFYPGFESGLIKRLPRPLFLGLKGLSHIESMTRLVWSLKNWRPDVIHFQWAPLPVVDKRFITFFRHIAPAVLTIHDSMPFNNDPSANLQRLGSIDIMKRFDQLICHTPAARARLESYGLDSRKIHVIPHGLLMELGDVPDPVKSDYVTLLLFGQIKHYKGIDVLLRAVAKLPKHIGRKCKVRIVGRAQMPMEPLYALVRELGLKDKVEFDVRFVPDAEIKDVLAQGDIHVFPYREIDASGVFMLSAAVGRAIVASNIGPFQELLQDGVHGALVKPEDPDALARALAPLIEDENRRHSAARAVKELANSIPSWTDIATMTEKVYRQE